MPMYFGPVGSEPASKVSRHAGHVVALHEDGILLRFEIEASESPIESFLVPHQAVSIVVFVRSPPPSGACQARGVITDASMVPSGDAKHWTARVRYTEVSADDLGYLCPGQA